MLQDPGGVPLECLLHPSPDASAQSNTGGQPLQIALALRLAISISAAIGAFHRRGIIHKDIKPANILADSTRPLLGDRFWYCFAASPRAAASWATRAYRRDSSIYGARTDGPNESLY